MNEKRPGDAGAVMVFPVYGCPGIVSSEMTLIEKSGALHLAVRPTIPVAEKLAARVRAVARHGEKKSPIRRFYPDPIPDEKLLGDEYESSGQRVAIQ